MVIVRKCGDDVWQIVFDYPYIQFNYHGGAEVRVNTKDLKELSRKLKEAGF